MLYPIHYVGNPTAEEVRQFQTDYHETSNEFRRRNHLPDKPIIALLAGSRRQEIKDNLPAMIEAVRRFADYQPVLAGAPGIPREYYDEYIKGSGVAIVYNDTYALLSHARAAVVTSGTATLETTLFRVPQVVCYETPLPSIVAFLRRHILKVKYISLVNLIDDSEVVRELVADTFSTENIARELSLLLPDGYERERMLDGYERIWEKLGNDSPSESAAHIIYSLVRE